MLIDNMLAYAEVDEILNLLEDEYSEKIPEKVRNFIKEEKMQDYKPKITAEKPLTEQNLKRETMAILAILNLNYWCKNETEKQQFLNELDANEQEQKELQERYNPDNLFKSRRYNNMEKEQDTALIKYKEPNILKKILEKITSFFKRK